VAALQGRFYACEEWVVNAHVAPALTTADGIVLNEGRYILEAQRGLPEP
jgi:hypothetical protein